LAEYGPNRLPESKRNPFLQYLGYMWNPLSWAMEAAAIIAIALLDYADFALILALLILNATISFVEESSAVRIPAGFRFRVVGLRFLLARCSFSRRPSSLSRCRLRCGSRGC
jgi:Cation transporter/ATPase, N-terminus